MILDEIWDKIKSYNNITIFRHVRPDGDAYGSQIGLKYLILDNHENCNVKCLGKKSPMYVKLFDDMDDNVSDEFIASSLAIVLDTANMSRIDDERYKLAKEVIKIDHHVKIEEYGDIEWVDDSVIATSEMITRIAYEKNLNISQKSAEALFCGIVTDSGRFLYPSVDEETFEFSTFLLHYGNVDLKKLYDVLYAQSEKDVRFKGYCQLNFKISPYGVAYMKIKPNLLNDFKVTPSYAAAMVNVLSNIDECEVHVHFVEDFDGRVRIEIRSKNLPVNLIASKYGGGGHRLASGTIVDNWNIADLVLNELDELCYRGEEHV
jgi:phosphoesterase RecJ-like protein